jgi:predicted P-loop ATPase/GTPase
VGSDVVGANIIDYISLNESLNELFMMIDDGRFCDAYSHKDTMFAAVAGSIHSENCIAEIKGYLDEHNERLYSPNHMRHPSHSLIDVKAHTNEFTHHLSLSKNSVVRSCFPLCWW